MGRPKRATPTPERLIFARNFRHARLAAGLTQQNITDQHGFVQSWLSQLETGQSPVNVDNMAELAKIVGVPLWKLLHPDFPMID